MKISKKLLFLCITFGWAQANQSEDKSTRHIKLQDMRLKTIYQNRPEYHKKVLNELYNVACTKIKNDGSTILDITALEKIMQQEMEQNIPWWKRDPEINFVVGMVIPPIIIVFILFATRSTHE